MIRCARHVLIPVELEAEGAILLDPAEDHYLRAEGGHINCKVVWAAPIDRITGLKRGILSHVLGVDMGGEVK